MINPVSGKREGVFDYEAVRIAEAEDDAKSGSASTTSR